MKRGETKSEKESRRREHWRRYEVRCKWEYNEREI
jgi:hypothetical protein